ncbi:MAG: T9SS type A sorting domain-containing protein [Bacteroidota bacterium]
MKTNILLLLTFGLLPFYSWSQCSFGAPDCFSAENVCFPIEGVLPPGQAGDVFPGCPANSIDNPVWYRINIQTQGLVELLITPTNCQGINGAFGIQAALVEDCNPNVQAISVNCACQTGPIFLSGFISNPGDYYLLVDGCAGDQCDYLIELLQGDYLETPITGPLSAPVVVPPNPCPGQVVQITAPDFPAAEYWEWNLPSDVTIISDLPYCSSIATVWGSSGGDVSYGVSNGCTSDTLQSPITTVDDYIFDSTVVDVSYCLGDSPGVVFPPGSGNVFQAGSWTVPLTTVGGCDSIVTLNVVALNSPAFLVVDTVCQGSELMGFPVSLGVLNESIDTVIILPNGATNGCDSTFVFQIFVYQDQPSISLQKLDCSITGGEIELSVPNNSFSTYSWSTSNGNITTATDQSTIRVDAPGDYTLDVITFDSEGMQICQGSQSISLFSSDFAGALDINIFTNNVLCNGSADGAITTDVTGGLPPYNYQWSIGATEPSLTDLPAGVYFLTVTDANACTIETSVTIGQPALLQLTFAEVETSCDGTGSARVVVAGGTSPYTFSWDDGNTGSLNTVLAPGDHTVSVTDANGCLAVGSVFIQPEIDFDVNSTYTDCDSTGGTAFVSNIVGTSNPLISWSNGESGAVITGLQPGGYSVTVEDPGSGCRNHKNVLVELDTTCLVTISGFVYDDQANGDCIIDASSQPISGIQVELNTGMVVFTNSNGYYEFNVPPGEYILQVNLSSPQVVSICTDPIAVDARTWGIDYTDNNFFVSVDRQVDLFMKISKRNQRPGFTRTLRICVMNRGADPADGTLYYTHDSLQQFERAFPMETTYSLPNREVAFDFTDLQPGQVYVYTVYMFTPLTVPMGTLLDNFFRVESTNGLEVNIADNEEYCQTLVTNAYDPNDKQVTPLGEGPQGIIQPEDTLLTYQIRFQNTGTDTAYTVILRDELDLDLQYRTLRPLAASHEYTACILPEGILEVTFENINLPDSTTDFEGSNGFIFFEIELEKALPRGTVINNTAGIYFDFNEPIITNTVVNTVGAKDVSVEQTLRGCGSVVVNDELYIADTTLVEVFDLPYNDSTVTTNVEVLDVFDIQVDTTLTRGDSYLGQVIDSDTTIIQNLSTVEGCDSTITTRITVLLTSLNNPFAAVKVDAFPNPFNGELVFRIEGLQQALVRLRLYDSQGRLVRESQHRDSLFRHQTAELSAGLYFYELEARGQIFRRGKVIKR